MGKTGILVALVVGCSLCSGGLRSSSAEAHHHADQIDVPRFAAAFNDWRLNHPAYQADDEGSARKHFATIDIKDRERWRSCRSAWKEMEKRMDEAGY